MQISYCHRAPTCIARSANFGFGEALFVAFAIAKVCDFHQGLWAAIQQCVFQLDVPIDHTHLVAVVQTNKELLKEPSGILLLHIK